MKTQIDWETLLNKYYPEDEPEDTYGSDDDNMNDPDVSSGDAGNDTEGTEDDS